MKEVQAAIAKLRSESEKIGLAIKALVHLDKFANANLKETKKKSRKKAKRVLSEAGRRAIAKAQKARWAMVRKNRKLQVVA